MWLGMSSSVKLVFLVARVMLVGCIVLLVMNVVSLKCMVTCCVGWWP